MDNFKMKYHLILMRADFVMSFISFTNIAFLFFVAQVYRFLVLGVGLEYGNRSAKVILPAIWHEEVWPMVIWIPVAMVTDFFIRRVISYEMDS